MRQPPTAQAAVAAEIARIGALGMDDLRRRWRAVFGRTAPAALSKHLLRHMIAGRLQEQAFGGLDRDRLTVLDGLARQAGPRRRHLKPGTVLVREYQGERHTVTVVPDGFDWQGTTYRSLSAIARAITGTAWSGPRFFALRGAGDDAAGDGTTPKNTSSAGPNRGRHQRRPAASRNDAQAATGSPPLHLESATPCVTLTP